MKHSTLLKVAVTCGMCLSPAGCDSCDNTPPTNVQMVYEWLRFQAETDTGLVRSEEGLDQAWLYTNALAVIAFLMSDAKGDQDRARAILDFYNSKLNSEFHMDLGGGATEPGGFFQTRSPDGDGIPHSDSNRWSADNAWLLIAIRLYQKRYPQDSAYDVMATALTELLIHLQQDSGAISAGWKNGDTSFSADTYAEGNLNCYKALELSGETNAAAEIKQWLDFSNDINRHWHEEALDLHSWRVLALGRGYGYCLQDVVPDGSLYVLATAYGDQTVTGFRDHPVSETIWAEGTAQMVLALAKSGYFAEADRFFDELEKMLIPSDEIPGSRTVSLHLDTRKSGHATSACWYIFAANEFDPYDDQYITSMKVDNPIVRIQGENFDRWVGSTEPRDEGQDDSVVDLSEGLAVHILGDNGPGEGDDSVSIEYDFYVMSNIENAQLRIRYADDMGGDELSFRLNGTFVPNSTITTEDTGDWLTYVDTEFTSIGPLPRGPHILTVDGTDGDSWGVNIDHIEIFGDVAIEY